MVIYERGGTEFKAERKSLILSENTFLQNFGSIGNFVTKIHGFGIILMEGETYSHNGDVFVEAFNRFSPISQVATIGEDVEESLENLIKNPQIQSTELKAKSLIGISGGGHFKIKNSKFNSNWHKEFPSDLPLLDSKYSQIFYFYFHSKEVLLLMNWF